MARAHRKRSQQAVVLLRRADADAHGARQARAARARRGSAGAPRARVERALRIVELHQDEVRVARPHALDVRQLAQAPRSSARARCGSSLMRDCMMASCGGSSSVSAASTVSCVIAYGGITLRSSATISGSAISVPQRAPASPCAFDSVRRITSCGRSCTCRTQALARRRTRHRPRRPRPARGLRGARAMRRTSASSAGCRSDCSASRGTPASRSACIAGARRPHPARSRRSTCSGTATTSAPWMRAATAYMPNVGGQIEHGVLAGAAEGAHEQVDGFVAAAAHEHLFGLGAVERGETRDELARLRLRIAIQAGIRCRRRWHATAARWRAGARAAAPTRRARTASARRCRGARGR